MKKLLLLFFLLACIHATKAQDSCQLRITLLTCAPGEELYSTFGHTAVRVQDLSNGNDLVFNYGTFEFGPDFYVQFIRGKLLYFLSVDDFPSFRYQYEMESRKIVEQELLLTCQEKMNLFEALQVNAQEENRYYRYDFLFDNCTTRARDIIRRNTKDSVVFKNILPANTPSFRDLIHSYLDKGKQPWSKLGIDILLGAKLDRKVSNMESMFLPDYLLKGFDSASHGNKQLVKPVQTILDMHKAIRDNGFFTPGLVFTLILLLVLVLYFFRPGKLVWFDRLFFLFLGLAGILLLFMWFGTDHAVCANNYNLLWALPTHVVAAFATGRTWTKTYFQLSMWIGILLLLTWFILPQEMNNALIPVVILATFRSWQLSRRKHAAKTDPD